ncbi:gamma-glutamyl-gamma-aminobutyrate hydrolase family protein [Marivita sp. GX14005]|uniref:gamma-glutamyl-gamma-aminobutyrate hydrolase family protein n=1 Tax=Marivita sp. GX14005 TaxID=2942276 RepID=UPI00201901C7|nr:gamma-glutamyl-gamma-aminobutyrate hydrolase family protein [Marivita sp. GX14005]MCL3880746.1 gamma-glutamyl-gamma-aminobutyrate hydrolase family protein [Marivita sp. GX14005]
MSRPLIAVTTSQRTGWRVFPFINLGIWLGGGRGERWRVGRVRDLAHVDGLVIGGGDDIGPELYGGRIGISARLDPERDALERRLAEAALERNIPVLGICRGAQMLNVALGGSLDQTAWETYSADRKITTILPKREVHIEAETHLSLIGGLAPMHVNALHSQAVDRLGEGLRISARDTGGMVQAIERIRDPFAIGVQWHPEYLVYAHRQRALFRALVTSAQAYRESRDQTRAMRRRLG